MAFKSLNLILQCTYDVWVLTPLKKGKTTELKMEMFMNKAQNIR